MKTANILDNIGSIVVTLAFMANAYAGAQHVNDESSWKRLEGTSIMSSPSTSTSQREPVQNMPVEQNSMDAEETETVKIIGKYRVTPSIGGISYYDKKTNMICHLVTDVSLLHPMGITCAPYVKKK